MTTKPMPTYQLEVSPATRYGSRVIEIRSNGHMWRELVNTDSYRMCTRALRRALDVLGLEATEAVLNALYQEVLAKADHIDALEAATRVAPPQPGTLIEVDYENLVRPELIHTPEASAIAIPVITSVDTHMTRRWQLYLCWHTENRREVVDLPRFLDLPTGERLWLNPWPGDPLEDMRAGWTDSARRLWLAGDPGPAVSDVYTELQRFFGDYLVFPPEDQEPVCAIFALYVMLTYTTPVWESIPYLHIVGTLGSGKTRAMELLSTVVFRPHATVDATPAVVFRRLHLYGGTLLVDEAERLRSTTDPDVQQLLAILNAGTRRGGAASRVDDEYRPHVFQVYGPKVLASISGAPPTLASRSITVTMIRADSHAPQLRRPIDKMRVRRLRDWLHSWALTHGRLVTILPHVDACPAEIYGRERDLWGPILALASWVDDEGIAGVYALVHDYALRTIRATQADLVPVHDEILLRSLAELLSADQSPTAAEVLERAQADPVHGHLFRHWTPRRVAEHLRRYGLTTRVRSGWRIYDRALLEPEIQRIERTYGLRLWPENGEHHA